MNPIETILSSESYPRVLIVGATPLQRDSGQGITLTNLFEGWKRENLGQVYFSGPKLDSSICLNNYRLSSKAFPLDHILRERLGGFAKVDHPLTKKIGAIGPTANAEPGFRARLHLAARALSDLGPVLLPFEARLWIQDFRPQVIYSCLGNARIIQLTTSISRLAGEVPIVPHFMDDWPTTLYADGRLWGLPYKILQNKLHSLFHRVPLGFSIGDHMAAEFKMRYGKEFYGFMNCVDDSAIASSAQTRANSTLVWTYVGGLHLNRWKSLHMLAQCIASRGGICNIFVPVSDIHEYGSIFENIPGVRLGSLNPEELMIPMMDSDVLIHVESFDPGESVFTLLSVSTKLAQYLSCGKIVFGFGPRNLASMKVINESGAGLVVGVERQADVDAAVDIISGDPSFRADCGARSLAFASLQFKKSLVCEKFRQRLLEAAQAGVAH